MDQAAYNRGQQAALHSLATWHTSDWSSCEAYRQHIQRNIQQELAHAQQQVRHTAGQSRQVWERHVSYFQGFLAGLH